MTDSSNIQHARDVLAKWQIGVVPGPWDFIPGFIATATPLINGTAGNPELLDAIDYLLEAATIHESRGNWSGSIPHAERIAAAIIAADERMTS